MLTSQFTELKSEEETIEKSESERLIKLRRLNDKVQQLERCAFGSPKNVHDEQILRNNLSTEAYNNYISLTTAYIQFLQKILEKMQEVQKLESYLEIQETEHDAEWWSNEQQVNSYLDALREKKEFFDRGYQKAIQEISSKKEKHAIRIEPTVSGDKKENPKQPLSTLIQFNNSKSLKENNSSVSPHDKNSSYFSKMLKYGLLGGLTCFGAYFGYKYFRGQK